MKKEKTIFSLRIFLRHDGKLLQSPEKIGFLTFYDLFCFLKRYKKLAQYIVF